MSEHNREFKLCELKEREKKLWEGRVADEIVQCQPNYRIELAKMLLTHRVEAGREYAKTMIPVTLTAIGAYLVLLAAIWPKYNDGKAYRHLDFWQTLPCFMPVFLFTLAASLYTWCYFALRCRDVDRDTGIVDHLRSEVLTRRWTSVSAGVVMYLGTVWGMAIAVVFLTKKW